MKRLTNRALQLKTNFAKTVKTILIAVVGLLVALTVNAQQEIDLLHLPAEYTVFGTTVNEGFNRVFTKISDYAHNNEHLTKKGVDSVMKVAADELGMKEQLTAALSGRHKNVTENPDFSPKVTA